MINQYRKAAQGLVLSAAALVGLVMHEGYTDKAVIPVKGDVPTMGFGTTSIHGSPVAMGDTITPPQALVQAMTDIQRFEKNLKACVDVPLAQHEYDAFISFSYNVGESAFCKSTLVKRLNAGDYPGACSELLRWRFVAGRDCKVRSNNCYGLYKRRLDEYLHCIGGHANG